MKFYPGYVRSAAAALAIAAAGCGVDAAREEAFGRQAFEAGDWRGAAEHFAKSIEAAPGGVDATIMLARAKLALGELDAATAALASLPPENASDADVVLLSAQIDFFAKRHASARDAFLRIARNASLNAETRSEGWAGAGAVDCFLASVAPESDPLLRDKARTELLAALRLNRRNAAARYHLGHLYRDVFGYVEAAKQQFDYFVYLDNAAGKRTQDVMRKIIPALKAEIAAKAAARPGAAGRNSVECAALLAKADGRMAKKDYATASKLYSDALSKDPLSYPAAIGLARSREQNKNLKDALRAYIIAVELDPYAVQTALDAAALAGRLGRWASATELYSRALAASDTSAKAAEGLEKALSKAGKTKAAELYRDYRAFIPARRK